MRVSHLNRFTRHLARAAAPLYAAAPLCVAALLVACGGGGGGGSAVEAPSVAIPANGGAFLPAGMTELTFAVACPGHTNGSVTLNAAGDMVYRASTSQGAQVLPVVEIKFADATEAAIDKQTIRNPNASVTLFKPNMGMFIESKGFFYYGARYETKCPITQGVSNLDLQIQPTAERLRSLVLDGADLSNTNASINPLFTLSADKSSVTIELEGATAPLDRFVAINLRTGAITTGATATATTRSVSYSEIFSNSVYGYWYESSDLRANPAEKGVDLAIGNAFYITIVRNGNTLSVY